MLSRMNKLSAKLKKKHSDLSELNATAFLVEKLRLKEKQLPAKLSSKKKAEMLVPHVCEKSGKKRYCNTDFDRFPWCI